MCNNFYYDSNFNIFLYNYKEENVKNKAFDYAKALLEVCDNI